MDYLKEKKLLLPVTVLVNSILYYFRFPCIGFLGFNATLILLNLLILVIIPIFLEAKTKNSYDPEVRKMFHFISRKSLEEFKEAVKGKSVHELEDIFYFGGVSLVTSSVLQDSNEILKYLLDLGIDVNRRARNFATPVEVAVHSNKLEALKIIMNYNPRLDLQNTTTQANAIETAVLRNNDVIFKFLLDKGEEFKPEVYKKKVCNSVNNWDTTVSSKIKRVYLESRIFRRKRMFLHLYQSYAEGNEKKTATPTPNSTNLSKKTSQRSLIFGLKKGIRRLIMASI